MISHKVMENGVVKCTKCTNRFHPLCTGIQEGWIGFLEFECSQLEIECRKHSRINIQARKRSSRAADIELTDTIGCSNRGETLGPNAKVSKRPLNQPLSPTIIENTGLTQEMRILEISNIPVSSLMEDSITPQNGVACSKLCQDENAELGRK